MGKVRQRILAAAVAALFSATAIIGSPGTKAGATESNKDKIKALLMEKLKNQGVGKGANAELANKVAGNNLQAILNKLNEQKKKNQNPSEKVRVIVQLDEKPAAEQAAKGIEVEKGANFSKINSAVQAVKASQSSVKEQVEKLTGAKMNRSYGYLVNGFSITVKRSDIDKIKSIQGVKSVTEAKVYKPDMNFAKQLTQAYSAWEDLNYKGEGMVVSIIDTGIDYTHKDLVLRSSGEQKAKLKDKTPAGPGKYFTEKVPYGYNFADGNTDIIDTNPATEMHGMHVAGIVAANGDSSEVSSFGAVQGVAPEAQLLAMKVFSNEDPFGGAYSDDIIAGIEDSVLHGADIINMSLGASEDFQDADDPEQIAVKNATDQGVVVVVAAGNVTTSSADSLFSSSVKNVLGLVDNGTIGTPGTSKDALTVASYENTKKIGMTLSYTADGITDPQPILYVSGSTDPGSVLKDTNGYELAKFSLPVDSDSKTIPLPDDGSKPLAGKLAFINISDVNIYEELMDAPKAGAVGEVIGLPEGYEDAQSIGDLGLSIPYITVGYSDGSKLTSLIEKNLKITFNGKKTALDNSNAGSMSSFSSWGVTSNLDFKPEISAPGGNIYSLANNNSYQEMSGTSMATPHTAGGEAIILEGIKARSLNLKGRDLVDFAKNTAINTASIQLDKLHNNVPYSPRRQGAGLLQIKDAAGNDVVVTGKDGAADISLKEIGKTSKFTLIFKNASKSPAAYTLDKTYVLAEKTDSKTSEVSDYNIDGAKLTLDKTSITVPANGTVQVNATITLPSSFNQQQFVEGFVTFKSKDSKRPNLEVPYIGFYGDWSKLQILDKPAWEAGNKLSAYVSQLYSEEASKEEGKPIQANIQVGTSLIDSSFGSMLGLETEDKYNMRVNPGKIAFSPNGDSIIDSVSPNLYMLRDARNLKTEVLDKDKKVIATVGNDSNVPKDILPYEIGYAIYGYAGKAITDSSWNGTVYDAQTGNYVPVPEGQYYIRVTAKADDAGAKEETIEMPVKVDLQAPTVKLTSIDTSDSLNYKLQWTEKDNLSGINISNGTIILVNGQWQDVKPVQSNGVYSANIKLEANKENLVQIGVTDNAGNIGYDQMYIGVGNIEAVTFDSPIQDGTVTWTNEFQVSGRVTADVATLKINNESVTIAQNYIFDYTAKLAEGANTLSVVAADKDGKELYNKSFNIICDTTKPNIVITDPKLEEGNVIYADKGTTVTIKGTITDSSKLQMALINGENLTLDSSGNFSYDYKFEGNSIVEVDAADEAGNFAYTDINVLEKGSSEPFQPMFYNIYPMSVIPNDQVKDGCYVIIGTVNRKPKVLKINDQEATIKDDLTFAVPVKVTQGINTFKIYAEDFNGDKLLDLSCKMLYDSEAPALNIKEPIVSSDGKVYTNKDKVTIKGQIGDNTNGCKLYINGDNVLTVNGNGVFNDQKKKTDFAYTVPVSGNGKIDIKLVDQFNNVADDIIDVVQDKTAPKAPIFKVSNTKPTNKAVQVTIKANAADKDIAKIEYSFNNKDWNSYKAPVKVVKNGKLYARITDYAGNVTSGYINISNIKKIASFIGVSGIEDGAIVNNAVQPVIAASRGSYKVQLDGKDYNGGKITAVGKHKLVVTSTETIDNAVTKTVNFEITSAKAQNVQKTQKTNSGTNAGAAGGAAALAVLGTLFLVLKRK